MRGNVIYVNRNPLGFGSIECRKTSKTTLLDALIIRTLTYRHYGIGLGNGTVVHFSCESIVSMKNALVVITTLEDFARDGVVEVDRNLVPAFGTETIVNRALSAIDQGFDAYHPRYNNCEHFAAWCATGEKKSQQDMVRDAWHGFIALPLRTKEKAVAAMAFFSFFS